MKRSQIKITLSIIMLLFIVSCKKYDEGGLVKKGDERIINTWKLEKYFRNGVDETYLLAISNYQEQYFENQSVLIFYTDDVGAMQSDNGAYSFSSDKKHINISNISSIKFTTNGSSLSSSSFEILKLTRDEYWYSFTNGGDQHEFHLKK